MRRHVADALRTRCRRAEQLGYDVILVPDHLDLSAPLPPGSRRPRPPSDPVSLVGTVIAGFDGWRCHLYRLAVHPGQRRRGVGGALLKAAEERFTALGGRRSDAMVLDRNDSARHAWRAAGYAPEPQWSRWVKHLAD